MEIRTGSFAEPLTQDISVGRQTADAGARFGAVLRAGAESLLATAASAVAGVPGAPLLSAALRGQSGGGAPESTAVGTSAGEGASDVGTLMRESQALNLYYLQVQEQMSQENRRWSALSNVMKARHETAKSAIGNIR